jgi:thiol-disulfide isomerase/thioredoxin
MRIARWLVVVAAVAVAAFVVTRPLGSDEPARSEGFYVVGAPTEGLRVGERAPELEATVGGARVSLEALDGGPTTLAQLRGTPAWLVFGTTWCAPCREEAPILDDAVDAAEGDITLLSISIQETAETVRAYVAEAGLESPWALDRTGAVSQGYGIYGYPTHYLLDADGVVLALHYGPLDREQADAYVALLLAD